MKKLLNSFSLCSIFIVTILSITACNQPITSEQHEHTFNENVWDCDENYHYHVATCEHTDLVFGKVNHNFDSWKVVEPATEASEGLAKRVCTVCNYTQEKIVERLSHEHRYNLNQWDRDSYYHWHNAICEHTDVTTDKAKHNFINNVCSDCGLTIDYSIAKIGDIVLSNGVVVKPEDFNTETDVAAALIVREKTSGNPAYGMGINLLSGSWCAKTSVGYSKVSNLVNISSGRNAYSILSAACNDADTYSIWKECRDYGKNFETNMQDGWFLPAPAEYGYIYSNKNTLNSVIINYLNLSSEKIQAWMCWTCRQAELSDMKDCAIVYEFYDGNAKYGMDKSDSANAYAMRCFE